MATTLKEPARGLYHRKEYPDGVNAPARPKLSGFVVNVGWNQLLGTRDGSIISNNFLDQQVALAAATHLKVKVRIGKAGGADHPQYVKDLCGTVQMFHCNDTNWTTYVPIVKWWEPIYSTLYDELLDKLKTVYDSNDTILDWVISAGRTFYMEPFIRQIACKNADGTSQNGPNLLAAGYTKAKDEAAMKRFIDSHARHFLLTRSSLAITTFQYYFLNSAGQAEGTTDGTAATSWTIRVMDYMEQKLGARATLGNNGYDVPLKGQPGLYEPPNGIEATTRQVCRYYQTEKPDRVHLRAALDRAVAEGINMIELPGNHPYEGTADGAQGALTLTELETYDTGLRNNSYPAGTSSAPLPPTITVAAAGSTQINVTVSPPLDATSIDEYRVYEGTTLVATVYPANLTVPIFGLAANSTHTYTAKSYNGTESAASATASTTTAVAPSPADTVQPTRPGAPVATITAAYDVDLTWEASEDDRTGVRRYAVICNGMTVGHAATNAWRDTTVIRGVTYTYTVVPYDGAAPANQGPESLSTVVLVPGEIGGMWLGVGELEMVFDPT